EGADVDGRRAQSVGAVQRIGGGGARRGSGGRNARDPLSDGHQDDRRDVHRFNDQPRRRAGAQQDPQRRGRAQGGKGAGVFRLRGGRQGRGNQAGHARSPV